MLVYFVYNILLSSFMLVYFVYNVLLSSLMLVYFVYNILLSSLMLVYFVYNILLSSLMLVYFVYNILSSSLMFVYRSREIPLRGSSSTAPTFFRTLCHPISTKSLNQICILFTRSSIPFPTLLPVQLSGNQSCSNCSGDSNSSAANCFKINNKSPFLGKAQCKVR